MNEFLRLLLRGLVVLALYSFLGGLLVFLWRDLRDSQKSQRLRERAYLRIGLASEGTRARLLKAVNLIGRASDNTIVVEDETVSNHHARLSYVESHWWLEDLGSKNGTLINDVPVERPVVMTSGDRIQMGAVEMVFQIGEHGEPTAPRLGYRDGRISQRNHNMTLKDSHDSS
jgi:pSer/pThr/pTyr-binding forkhead associated (FHA) protein